MPKIYSLSYCTPIHSIFHPSLHEFHQNSSRLTCSNHLFIRNQKIEGEPRASFSFLKRENKTLRRLSVTAVHFLSTGYSFLRLGFCQSQDLIRFLSRSIPAPQAIKILNDEMQCDIIKIGNLVRNGYMSGPSVEFTAINSAIKILNDEMQCDIIEIGNLVHNKERFVKRRQHLVGPNSSTLKALEILTGCYILVQGNTVGAMGSFKGLKQVRRVVEDCILNKMHPVYHIKILMMKKELEKDPALANENWDRFLPKFKKKNVKQKKVKSKEKKPYTPFPPPPQPSRIDKLLESGEYFQSERKKESKKWQEKQEKQAEKTAENKRKRDAVFIPPEEPSKQDSSQPEDKKNDVAAVAKSLKEKAKKFGKQKSIENINAEDYIAEKPSKKKSKRS